MQPAAEERADAQRLMTHRGVRPVVAFAHLLAIGSGSVFPRGKCGSFGAELPIIAGDSDSAGKFLARVGAIGETPSKLTLGRAGTYLERPGRGTALLARDSRALQIQ